MLVVGCGCYVVYFLLNIFSGYVLLVQENIWIYREIKEGGEYRKLIGNEGDFERFWFCLFDFENVL